MLKIIEAQWLMLQQDKPDDYCIATGLQFSVRDFVNFAWEFIGNKIIWEGDGLNEKGIDKETGKVIVAVDKNYFRPSEVETLLGDATKAKKNLNWQPKISLEELVNEMMEHDLKNAQEELILRSHKKES